MNFTDRMFLLWHSTEAMAAAMPSGLLFFTFTCFPLGVVSYVNTFVAQYHGAGRPERIGLAVWQAVRISLWATPLLIVTIPAARWLFSVAGHEPRVAALEIEYFQAIVFGGGGVLLSAAFSAYFTGQGRARVVMLVDAFGALLNVALDYAWIFGRWGFPEWGVAGAAWATVVSQWVQAAIYWRLIHRSEECRRCRLVEGRRPDRDLMRRLWRFGGPNGLQMVIDMAAFSVFLLFVGQLGTEAMAATNLAFNVNSVAFVPMLGVAMAVSTIVGQQLGRDRPDRASRAAWTGLWIAEIYMGTLAVLYVALPEAFLFGHAWGANPAEFARIHDLTVALLRFVAAYCLFDALNVVFSGAIKGAGDTHFILKTTLVMAPLPVLVAWAGMRLAGYGLFWCWTVVTVWCCCLGLIYLARFLHGHWRTMRVIEPEAELSEVDALSEQLPAIGAGSSAADD